MRAFLKNLGYKIVEEESEADIFILNTCTVTKRTELNVVRRLKQLNELKKQGKEVIVAGCMAAVQPELVKGILGNGVKMVTPDDIRKILPFEFDVNIGIDGVIGVVPIGMGCVGNCSYCIVKKARGDLRSYPPEKICGVVKSEVERGAREIRITAQDCSAYGLDMDGKPRLPELLQKIASIEVEIESEFRIRVGMMNPFTMFDVVEDLLETFDSDKIYKFFHIPVQSGSDRVLSDMRRNYKVADFVDIVERIRKRFKNSTICTDFIIGFPTETEEDFFSSLRLLERIKPEKVNITRFSPRPGTEASESKMKDLLEREKKDRSRVFTTFYHCIAAEKNKKWMGKTVPVLITERGKKGKGGVIGRDMAYRTVVIQEKVNLGIRCDVKIEEAKSTYLVGKWKKI
jgi:MiaB-like tRNA modifying enzyme